MSWVSGSVLQQRRGSRTFPGNQASTEHRKSPSCMEEGQVIEFKFSDLLNGLKLNSFLFGFSCFQSCSECSPPMLLPNSCSAAAHQRIHQGSSPHVCPECGGTAKQAQFRTHVDETCLHFSRRIGYRCDVSPCDWFIKALLHQSWFHSADFFFILFFLTFLFSRCSSCLVVFGGLNSVKSHIQQAHCDMFHKCPSCPMAFKSAPSIQNHITAQHPGLPEGQPMYVQHTVWVFTLEFIASLSVSLPRISSFTGWSISVSCVTQCLPTNPCCMPTLTLI